MQIVPARADPPLHAAAPTPRHVNVEHGSVFGFRPNPNTNPNSGMSNTVASQSREKAQDSEPDAIGMTMSHRFFSLFYSL